MHVWRVSCCVVGVACGWHERADVGQIDLRESNSTKEISIAEAVGNYIWGPVRDSKESPRKNRGSIRSRGRQRSAR